MPLGMNGFDVQYGCDLNGSVAHAICAIELMMEKDGVTPPNTEEFYRISKKNRRVEILCNTEKSTFAKLPS